jgi:hypothetical protein
VIGKQTTAELVREHGAYAFYEGFGVEFGAQDLVGAVGEDGYSPVADEGYELAGVGGFDVGAEGFGVVDSGFAFYVDEDEVVGCGQEQGEAFGVVEAGVYLVAGEAEDLIAEGTKHLAAAYVEYGGLVIVGAFHGLPLSIVITT